MATRKLSSVGESVITMLGQGWKIKVDRKTGVPQMVDEFDETERISFATISALEDRGLVRGNSAETRFFLTPEGRKTFKSLSA